MERRTRTMLAVATASMALLISACGTPPPGDSTTTTTQDPMVCLTDKKTIETALEAWALGTTPPRFPDTLQVLHADGYLKHPPADTWIYTTDGATFSLSGPC